MRARLTAGIKEAKRRHRQRLERDFNTNSSKIYMAGDTKCHRLQKQEHLHHMWGPTAGWAEHIPSPQQRLSCEVCSASRPPATVSNHSGREKTCYLNLLLTFSTRHSPRRLFPPSSKQPSSSPYLKVCCVESYIYDIATALHPVFTHRILDRRRQRHTPLCTSEELGRSRWTVTGSFELPSLRTYLGHYTWPRWSRKHSFCKNWSLFQGRLTDGPSASWLETSQTLVLHGPSAQDRRALQRVIKPPARHWSPAAIWQQIRRYLLLYHHTTEQLHSSDCETPQIINTSFPKILWRNPVIHILHICSFYSNMFSGLKR